MGRINIPKDMKVVKGVPPNYDKIKAKMDPPKQAIFCYGDTIYTPSLSAITPELKAHEHVHYERQQGIPEAWWDRYLDEPQFRLDEEIPAHQAEYQEYIRGRKPNRQSRRRVLMFIAKRLSGPLYGGLINLREAKRLIKGVENK